MRSKNLVVVGLVAALAVPAIYFVVAATKRANREQAALEEKRLAVAVERRIAEEGERAAAARRAVEVVKSATEDALQAAVSACQKAVEAKVGKSAFNGVYFPGMKLDEVETVRNARMALGARFSSHQVMTSKSINPVADNFRYLNSSTIAPEIVMVAAYQIDSFAGLKAKLVSYRCGLEGLATRDVSELNNVTLN